MSLRSSASWSAALRAAFLWRSPLRFQWVFRVLPHVAIVHHLALVLDVRGGFFLVVSLRLTLKSVVVCSSIRESWMAITQGSGRVVHTRTLHCLHLWAFLQCWCLSCWAPKISCQACSSGSTPCRAFQSSFSNYDCSSNNALARSGLRPRFLDSSNAASTLRAENVDVFLRHTRVVCLSSPWLLQLPLLLRGKSASSLAVPSCGPCRTHGTSPSSCLLVVAMLTTFHQIGPLSVFP